jgi:hypothetical protein
MATAGLVAEDRGQGRAEAILARHGRVAGSTLVCEHFLAGACVTRRLAGWAMYSIAATINKQAAVCCRSAPSDRAPILPIGRSRTGQTACAVISAFLSWRLLH